MSLGYTTSLNRYRELIVKSVIVETVLDIGSWYRVEIGDDFGLEMFRIVINQQRVVGVCAGITAVKEAKGNLEWKHVHVIGMVDQNEGEGA